MYSPAKPRPKSGYQCKICGKQGGQPDSHWFQLCPLRGKQTGSRNYQAPRQGYVCKFCHKPGGEPDSHWFQQCPLRTEVEGMQVPKQITPHHPGMSLPVNMGMLQISPTPYDYPPGNMMFYPGLVGIGPSGPNQLGQGQVYYMQQQPQMHPSVSVTSPIPHSSPANHNVQTMYQMNASSQAYQQQMYSVANGSNHPAQVPSDMKGAHQGEGKPIDDKADPDSKENDANVPESYNDSGEAASQTLNNAKIGETKQNGKLENETD